MDFESTDSLIVRICNGDPRAEGLLIDRFLPGLRRWAAGRLPSRARSLADTDDLVQITLIRALNHLKTFEPKGRGAFAAYLRTILRNQIVDHIRRAGRTPGGEELKEQIAIDEPSPLERAIGRENIERYEAALDELKEKQREAVVMRIELGFTHQEVAAELGFPSANAARMQVARALMRLAEVMDED